MNCEQMAELFAEYLEGGLEAPQRESIERHIGDCEQCHRLAEVARKLAVLPQEQPSPALRERFRAVLEAYEAGHAEEPRIAANAPRSAGWGANWFRSPLAAMAATAALLVLGFVGGRYATNENNVQSREEIASMKAELANMRQLTVLSMLEEESASQRLQGVSLSTREAQADPQILAALLRTLRYDSSVDVRLAALDALSRYGSHPQVRQGLAEALSTQQSPLVQVELIDLLVQLRDRNVLEELRAIQQDNSTDPAVRQRAEKAIHQLS